jgi:glycosyltransferase involved in cell wall biosynthesis
VVRNSAALIVTSENRERWVSSRPWLPKRPTAVAPVFSNLPAPTGRGERASTSPTVGLFGYAHEGSDPALVLEALRLLREQGLPARLRLLGAPGPDSDAGRRWQQAARSHGLASAVDFTGTLSPQALADALAACEVLLFADRPGPSSRKTTLAAALASGSPVLALDGPRSWPALVDARAALMVQPRPDDIADRLAELLSQTDARLALAARGRRFYDDTMSVEHSASTVLGLLDQVIGTGPDSRRASHVVRAAS